MYSVEKQEFKWPSEESLLLHFRALLAAIEDPCLPVRVRAALAICEMVKNKSHNTGVDDMRVLEPCLHPSSAPGHDWFGGQDRRAYVLRPRRPSESHGFLADILKLSDETDMDVLNNCMETLVEWFHEELMPVSVQLTARLVCCSTNTLHCS